MGFFCRLNRGADQPAMFAGPCLLACYALFHVVQLNVHVPLKTKEADMDTITYTSARGNLAKTMKKVCDDHSPVVITRKSSKPVVMMSLEDFQALEETAYLLRSPKNARRLLKSITELKAGKGTERELSE